MWVIDLEIVLKSTSFDEKVIDPRKNHRSMTINRKEEGEAHEHIRKPT